MLPGVISLMMLSTDVRFFDRTGKIEHCQKREHACLHEGYQETETENRYL